MPGTAPIAFRATVDRDGLVAHRLERVVDELCEGSITPLLSHLASRKLSARDREELRAFLDRLRTAGRPTPASRRKR